MSHLSPSPLDRILELKGEAEKQKVELTPEVKAYIQSHLKGVQAKLDRGEDVTEEDMEFIDVVRHKIEALKRHITPQQWIDLLHMADASGHQKEWIDRQFQFPGESRIVVDGDLYLDGCNSLTHLPDHLKVAGSIDLDGCFSLLQLPENLEVAGSLVISSCTAISHLPDGLVVDSALFLSNNLQPKVSEDAERLKSEGRIKVIIH